MSSDLRQATMTYRESCQFVGKLSFIQINLHVSVSGLRGSSLRLAMIRQTAPFVEQVFCGGESIPVSSCLRHSNDHNHAHL